MSNSLRYDSLLIHYLAAELDDLLRGRRLLGLAIDPEARRAVFDLEDLSLSWNLHPREGWLTTGRLPISPTSVDLARRSRVARITSPTDERVIEIILSAAARRPGRAVRVVIELLGNQWNLIAVGPDDRIVATLWRRIAGEREIRPGQLYNPPPPTERRGADRPLSRAEWEDLFAEVPADQLTRRIISTVAYTSPLNLGSILGIRGLTGDIAAGQPIGAAELIAAYDRYHALASLPTASPRLLSLPGGPQPYPLPLRGIDDLPFPTLLAAFSAAHGVVEGGPGELGLTGPGLIPLEFLDRIRLRIRRVERRRERLEAEVTDAAERAERARYQADLLMAQLHLVRKGMQEVELPDWEGGTEVLELDPTLTPSENAGELYSRARREARAAERVPELIRGVDTELSKLRELLARAERGEADPAEIDAILPSPGEIEGRGGRRGLAREESSTLPYRRYRTASGLEIRVGRSGRANDDLTFRHSAPNDIWLHARDVGGAHVILRWGDPTVNPPARDLVEAANLASLHSGARTSGIVAVDWTRRKYVRKPRKSAPGAVTFERGQTIFVEPDPELERRSRVG